MADNRRREPRKSQDERDEFDERVVDIRRVAKVIKGGRRFAFRTVVVVGDNKGNVGIGIGKARAVPDSIRKAAERARRNIEKVALSRTTIPYKVIGRHGGARVAAEAGSARYRRHSRRRRSCRVGSRWRTQYPDQEPGKRQLA